jgi:hypothetical protein
MKLTKTYYFQYGSQFTPGSLIANPTAPPADFPAPSGLYSSVLSIPSTLSQYINIPFKVTKIHIKGITWTNGRAGNQGNSAASKYITLLSSLTDNRPVGMVHTDSQFAMGTVQDIEHTFNIPKVINGYYDFTAYSSDGAVYGGYNETVVIPDIEYFFDSYSITIEFNGENEIF